MLDIPAPFQLTLDLDHASLSSAQKEVRGGSEGAAAGFYCCQRGSHATTTRKKQLMMMSVVGRW